MKHRRVAALSVLGLGLLVALAGGLKVLHTRALALVHRSDVSQRWDLSGAHDQDVKRVQERISEYLELGLNVRVKPADLRVATRSWPSGGILLTFGGPVVRDLALLPGNVEVSPAAGAILQTLRSDGSVSTTSPDGTHEIITSYAFVNEFPYTRLGWWPPAHPERLRVYERRTTWKPPGLPIGTRYYLFVDKEAQRAYLLGW
jgi:hypothetical protein